MPRSGSTPDVLVDTSVALALLLGDHEAHDATHRALLGRSLGLSGHAAFETFSVLTRLPPPARRSPETVSRLIAGSFPYSQFLGARQHADLSARMGTLRIAGGAVYDALVGSAAVAHQLALVTRDRRALPTYRALEVDVELLD
ncbi:MAG: type II toxin-antitoxin system VapC family toxin [Solirubrobacterales bacterium]|nr:type II toxin-antitoxin system VapC family toxin [Solirubrobacterales bacterium]